MITVSTSKPGRTRASSAQTISACRSASGEPRVPNLNFPGLTVILRGLINLGKLGRHYECFRHRNKLR
jgi:hypothetical protein